MLAFPVAFIGMRQLTKLQRGLYLDTPSCSAANREDPDVTSLDKHVYTQLKSSFKHSQMIVLICSADECKQPAGSCLFGKL